MLRIYSQTLFIKDVILIQNHNFLRYLRDFARRGIGPKFKEDKDKTLQKYDNSRREFGPKIVKAKVKTETELYDRPNIKSYKDFVTSVRESNLGDELEIEKQFLNEDYHGDAIERCESLYDEHLKEEAAQRRLIKKKIIQQKYFKLDKESNLLTCAAKEQIRFLHKSNPLEWNCKALSECFPISEAGVKKLLKCNFVITCPEKIKAHDEKVAERWRILKSGKPTDLIHHLTQKLFKEGKLVDDYFSGNHNLPTTPPSRKVIEVKKEKNVGEFSAIVHTYVEYENKKLLTSDKDNDNEQVSITNSNLCKKSVDKKLNYKFTSDELNDPDPDIYPSRTHRKQKVDDSELSFSQFKEVIKDKTLSKLKYRNKNEYDEFVLQQISKTNSLASSKHPYDPKDCFLKVPKYQKDGISAMYENNKNIKNIYKYDEKLGYQYPVGKNIRGKINLSPALHERGKLHKVGQCVYDDNGEFLYKICT